MGQTMILSVDPLSSTAFSSTAAEFLTVRLRLSNPNSTATEKIQGLTLHVTVEGGTGGNLPKVDAVNVFGPWSGTPPPTPGFFVNTPLTGYPSGPWELVGPSVSAQDSSAVSIGVVSSDGPPVFEGLALGAGSDYLLGDVTFRRTAGDMGPWTIKMFMPGNPPAPSGLDAVIDSDPWVLTYPLNELEFQITVVPEPEQMAMAFGLVLVGVGAWRRAKARRK